MMFNLSENIMNSKFNRSYHYFLHCNCSNFELNKGYRRCQIKKTLMNRDGIKTKCCSLRKKEGKEYIYLNQHIQEYEIHLYNQDIQLVTYCMINSSRGKQYIDYQLKLQSQESSLCSFVEMYSQSNLDCMVNMIKSQMKYRMKVRIMNKSLSCYKSGNLESYKKHKLSLSNKNQKHMLGKLKENYIASN